MIELNFPDPVTSEEGFFDRRREWTLLERTFRSRESKPAIILGERRIGKTSLQSVAALRLKTDPTLGYEPLFLPFGQLMHSLDDFARELVERLYLLVDQNVQETGLYSADGGLHLISLSPYTQALRHALGHLGQQTLLVCVDEFDATLMNCPAEDARRLSALITDLVSETERTRLPLRFLFSMTGLPETITQSFSTPFTSNAMYVEVKAFSYQDMVEMVTTLLTAQAHVSDEALKRLFEISGGHPYITKLLLDCLLEPHYFEVEGLVIDTPDIEQAAEQATDDTRARSVFANVYDVHLTDPQKELMLLLTERRTVTKGELRVFGAEYLAAAEALARRDYLAKVEDPADPEQDRYQFGIQFLSLWLRRWERYESEVEKRLRTLRLRLRRMADSWAEIQPTAVTEDTLRKLGFRP